MVISDNFFVQSEKQAELGKLLDVLRNKNESLVDALNVSFCYISFVLFSGCWLFLLRLPKIWIFRRQL